MSDRDSFRARSSFGLTIVAFKNIGRFQYSFGLTIVTFERPGQIGSAFGVTIVAFQRPRCFWTYYNNVLAIEKNHRKTLNGAGVLQITSKNDKSETCIWSYYSSVSAHHQKIDVNISLDV